MGYIDPQVEAVIAHLAAAGDAVIARSSLRREGVPAKAIDRRVAAGRLVPLHPGVYYAGHGRPSRIQRHRAAVLGCGEGAVARRLTACELWRMLAAHPGPPEVLIAGRRRRGPAGVAVARTGWLPPHEVTTQCGIPVTTPARALLDLAATGHPGLDEALNEAFVLRLVQRGALEALARSGRRGSARLRALLATSEGYTRRGAERELRSLIREAQIAVPRYNQVVAGRERDAVWLEQRVVLEVDGYAAHSTPRAFQADRRRDQEVAAAGFLPLRATWQQLTRDRLAVAARLAAALAHAARRAAA